MSLALTYVGHATVLVELDGERVLTDPMLRRRVFHIRRHAPLVPIDSVGTVLVSHGHYDHMDVGSLLRLGRRHRIIVPRGLGRELRMRGFRNVEEVRAGDVLKAGPVEIEVTPAAHSGSRFTARAAAVGYMLRGSQTVYFAGDTDLFAGLEQIGGEGIDVALLPVWGWGPKVGKGHLDPTRAAEAARMLHPKLAVPIHWGTYGSSGGDVTRRPPEEFARLCACETRIVDPGERLVIDGYAADGPLEPSAA